MLVRRGTWQDLTVAIKTIFFQNGNGKDLTKAEKRAIAEVAIACSMAHPNCISTYAHDLKTLDHKQTSNLDAGVTSYKLYLVQVCDPQLVGVTLQSVREFNDSLFACNV